jgi:hypothetical protein
VKALCPETLDQLADRWTATMNRVDRHIGRYPDAYYIEVAVLIQHTDHLIKPDPFEQDVLQTASKLAEDGNLKMALFRLHEVIESRSREAGP